MFHTNWFGKVYHLSHNRKGNLMSHQGDAEKCKRVHYDWRGRKL